MCGLGLGFWVEEIGATSHAAGPKFKAQMGLGTFMSCIGCIVKWVGIIDKVTF